jgi:hypothetical protein
MWGGRVVRIGVLMGGLVALAASNGCCDCCQKLWGTKDAPKAKAATESSVQGSDTSGPPDGRGRTWFSDQPSQLPVERGHGGFAP